MADASLYHLLLPKAEQSWGLLREIGPNIGVSAEFIPGDGLNVAGAAEFLHLHCGSDRLAQRDTLP